MKLNLHPKGIPKQEPLGADTPLKKGGVVVGMRKEGDKEKIYFVGDDCHLLCVGATRSGKSRCLVLESICLLGLAGESIFCSDPKAELFHYTADFLKKLGYEVLVLDFKNPEKSMRYNLLQPIIDAISEGDTDRAEMLPLVRDGATSEMDRSARAGWDGESFLTYSNSGILFPMVRHISEMNQYTLVMF